MMFRSTQHRLGLLVSLILTLIILMEFAGDSGRSTGVFANSETSSFFLTKGADTVRINSGEWLVAVAPSWTKVQARGQFVSASLDSNGVGSIKLQTKKGYVSVPTANIATLWQGHAREVGAIAGKSALAGLGIGAVIGAIIGTDGYWPLTVPICAGIDGAVLATGGALAGLIRQGFATAYSLSPQEWTLVIVPPEPSPIVIPIERP